MSCRWMPAVSIATKTGIIFTTAIPSSPAITSSQGQLFSSIYTAQWTNNDGPQNPLGAVSNPNTYTAHEDIGAGYLSLGWKGPKADWTAGLRYENTRQDFVSSVDPTVSYGKTGSIRYFDFLPSAQVKIPAYRPPAAAGLLG